ncbi:65-kDa microtubule-associated protein 3 [Heracleum sosnowskyi]|uniref:65-kDa microtubule-associated protein 3 n=1 Tax=Heracleum sosnowskyi TaxID=360622 RepID=A0AAD8IXM3_9APIA|nr:65-kDa microtubule-associated protein 3 [Heracleum sosnowskyi]
MYVPQINLLMKVETTCGSLLNELKGIWDDVGESDIERDKMLLELERECLEVYRRKVDSANKSRAQLRQAIADAEAELASICSAMGERPIHIRQSDQTPRSLKEELRTIRPQLEEMRKRKLDRRNQFYDVVEQIQKIRNEIYRSDKSTCSPGVAATDLSLRKLEELQQELQDLQKEKSDRLKQVLDHQNTLNSICLVLGVDFQKTVNEVYSSLGDSYGTKSLSNDTIECLAVTIKRLRELKIQRMHRLQDLATSMLELWNLMDTPIEEQQMFQNVTRNIAASEHELKEPSMLSEDSINYVAAEVYRLEALKASKMKELVCKKRSELEDICRKTHMILESDSGLEVSIQAIETGAVEPGHILEQIELQIGNVKEEALSRKEILEKVEKWMTACEEECWLEEYNRDENRYNAGRGTHLTLKRAEKARALVNKLPGIIQTIASKTDAWEKERGIEFTYDGIGLLSMLQDYNILRKEKEQERKRQRDQKKLEVQLIVEQEVLFGSKPSPKKPQSLRKGSRLSCGGTSNQRFSHGGAVLKTPKTNQLHSIKGTPNSRQTKTNERVQQCGQLNPRRDSGVVAFSAGTKGFDIADLPVKKHSFNAHEAQSSPVFRKPFSLISSKESPKANAANKLEDMNGTDNEMAQKAIESNNSFLTPSKTVPAVGEANMSPKTMKFPALSTPLTPSIPMYTSTTPAPQSVATTLIREAPEEIEYSFEELRAGFILPEAHLKPLFHL